MLVSEHCEFIHMGRGTQIARLGPKQAPNRSGRALTLCSEADYVAPMRLAAVHHHGHHSHDLWAGRFARERWSD